jgi:hypothetical protein
VLKSEPPESKYYVLTSLGKGQLRLLLEQVERNELKANQPKMKARTANVWNRTYIGKGCHRDPDTVAKILKAVDPGAKPGGLGDRVREDVMLALFRWLYERTGRDLAGKYGEGITDDLLRKQKYWAKFDLKPNGRMTTRETAELLRELDASAQRKEFKQAIAQRSANLVVGVSVPCVGSQRWLIDCLINTPKYLEKRHWLKIQVSEHPVRFDPVNLIEALSGTLKCKSEEALWQKLKRANRPLIISLYDFGQTSEVTPEDVVREFWVPLQKKMEQRKVSSQIILLMADHNLASGSGVDLTPLSSISQDDVKGWMFDKMDRDRVDTWLARSSSWQWDQPGRVLDRVCNELLGLGNGIVDLYKTWEGS